MRLKLKYQNIFKYNINLFQTQVLFLLLQKNLFELIIILFTYLFISKYIFKKFLLFLLQIYVKNSFKFI